MAKRRSLTVDKTKLFGVLGYEPHSGQARVHASRARVRVLACGVRWGKTKAAAMEAIAAALEPRADVKGWIVAPTYDLADRVFDMVRDTVFERLRHRVVTFSGHERRLVLTNLGGGRTEMRAKSADNPVSLLGEGLDFAIVDEAARMKPAIWQSYLTQRLVDRKGWALLISTPRGKGWYYDVFRRGQGKDAHYASWNAPSWQNPLLDRALIEADRERLPERTFLQEYEAQFLEGSGSVFRYVREAATGEFEEPIAGNYYTGGLDLAKVEDYTVLTIIDKHGHVVFLDRFHRLDWSLQVARVKAAVSRYKCMRVFVDTTGIGDPVHEMLRAHDIHAEAYTLTAGSKKALVDHISILLEQRKLVLPRPELCPDLVEELEGFEFSVSDAGNVRTGAASGLHDDCVISLGLACQGLPDLQRELRFIRIPRRSFFNERPDVWRRVSGGTPFGIGGR
ncbi:MAG: hypothetical protein EPO68_03950 [Planctomycetota bacterium]|nr:MAG: hypothetical protein EPO68_03950 [Planctomycetota bacterium]